jgi:hypothetical protein
MFIDNAPSNVAEVPTIAHVDFLMLLGRAYLRQSIIRFGWFCGRSSQLTSIE